MARHSVEPGLPKANTVFHLNNQRKSRNSQSEFFFFGCLVTVVAAAADALVATGTKTYRGARVGGRNIVLCCMAMNRTQTVQTKSSNRADIGFLHKVVCHDYNPCRACHQPLQRTRNGYTMIERLIRLESPPAQALSVLGPAGYIMHASDWESYDKMLSGALSLGKNEERTTKHVSLSQVITRCMMGAMIPLPHEYIYYRNNSIVITILSRIE